MPLGQASGFPRADPGGRVNPRFWHRLIRFRHFIDGSLALASLNLACRNLVPAFPQRSPPRLLSAAAYGGLRPEPDCRPRRALLHLSYSCAPPCGPAMLVTHDPWRTSAIARLRRAPPHRQPSARVGKQLFPDVSKTALLSHIPYHWLSPNHEARLRKEWPLMLDHPEKTSLVRRQINIRRSAFAHAACFGGNLPFVSHK
jgi:hypothetical protein